MGAVDFRILGPLEVWYEGRPIPVPGAKQRALLAMLLLHAGEVVSADRMLDAVWGEDPPEAGSTALRVRLSQLRKTLAGAGSSLVTRPPGYVMQLRDDELDLRRCERLVAAGDRALQEGRPAEAVDALRDALALWRGPPLADLAYESFAQAPIVRLEELRLAALELRVEAELSLGRHGGLVGELQDTRPPAPDARAPVRPAHARALPRRAPVRRAGRLSHGAAAAGRRGRASSRARNCSSWRARSSPRTRASISSPTPPCGRLCRLRRARCW